MATEVTPVVDAPAAAPGAPQEGGAVDSDGKPEGQAPVATETPPEGQEAAPAAADKPAEAEPPKPPGANPYAVLARKEKALRAREQGVKHLEGLEKLAAEDPVAAARKLLGDDFFERLVLAEAGVKKEPPTEAERIAQLEERISAREKQEEDQRKADAIAASARQQQQAVRDTLAIAKTQEAKYRRTLRLGEEVHDLVWQTAQELYQEHGAKLTDAQVLDLVEYRLAEAAKILAAEEPPAPAAPAADSPAKTAQATTTLTNRAVSEAPINGSDADDLPMDPDERSRAILKRFKFYRTESAAS